MNAQKFNKLASDSSKTFRLEAFSFTFDFGLNIYFDDFEDLKNIIGDSEIEFWQLEVQADSVELDVDSFHDLKMILAVYEDEPSNAEQLVYLSQIVKEGYAKWDEARDWHENNYFCEDMSDSDFGHYLIHELSCLEIPDNISAYFDYERYGKESKWDFVVIADSIYQNS